MSKRKPQSRFPPFSLEFRNASSIKFESIRPSGHQDISPDVALHVINSDLAVYSTLPPERRKIHTTQTRMQKFALTFSFSSPIAEDPNKDNDVVFDLLFLVSNRETTSSPRTKDDHLRFLRLLQTTFGSIAGSHAVEFKDMERLGLLTIRRQGRSQFPHLLPPMTADGRSNLTDSNFTYEVEWLTKADAALATNITVHTKGFVRLVDPVVGLTEALADDFRFAKLLAERQAAEMRRQREFVKKIKTVRKGGEIFEASGATTRAGESIEYSTLDAIPKVRICDAVSGGLSACLNREDGALSMVCALAECCARSYLHAACVAGGPTPPWCGHCSRTATATDTETVSDSDTDGGSDEETEELSDAEEDSEILDHPYGEGHITPGDTVVTDLMGILEGMVDRIMALPQFSTLKSMTRVSLGQTPPADGISVMAFLGFRLPSLAVFTQDTIFIFDPAQTVVANRLAVRWAEKIKGQRVLVLLRTFPRRDRLTPKTGPQCSIFHVARALGYMLTAFTEILEAAPLGMRNLGMRYTLVHHVSRVHSLAKVMVGKCNLTEEESVQMFEDPDNFMAFLVDGIVPTLVNKKASVPALAGSGHVAAHSHTTVASDSSSEDGSVHVAAGESSPAPDPNAEASVASPFASSTDGTTLMIEFPVTSRIADGDEVVAPARITAVPDVRTADGDEVVALVPARTADGDKVIARVDLVNASDDEDVSMSVYSRPYRGYLTAELKELATEGVVFPVMSLIDSYDVLPPSPTESHVRMKDITKEVQVMYWFKSDKFIKVLRKLLDSRIPQVILIPHEHSSHITVAIFFVRQRHVVFWDSMRTPSNDTTPADDSRYKEAENIIDEYLRKDLPDTALEETGAAAAGGAGSQGAGYAALSGPWKSTYASRAADNRQKDSLTCGLRSAVCCVAVVLRCAYLLGRNLKIDRASVVDVVHRLKNFSVNAYYYYLSLFIQLQNVIWGHKSNDGARRSIMDFLMSLTKDAFTVTSYSTDVLRVALSFPSTSWKADLAATTTNNCKALKDAKKAVEDAGAEEKRRRLERAAAVAASAEPTSGVSASDSASGAAVTAAAAGGGAAAGQDASPVALTTPSSASKPHLGKGAELVCGNAGEVVECLCSTTSDPTPCEGAVHVHLPLVQTSGKPLYRFIARVEDLIGEGKSLIPKALTVFGDKQRAAVLKKDVDTMRGPLVFFAIRHCDVVVIPRATTDKWSRKQRNSHQCLGGERYFHLPPLLQLMNDGGTTANVEFSYESSDRRKDAATSKDVLAVIQIKQGLRLSKGDPLESQFSMAFWTTNRECEVFNYPHFENAAKCLLKDGAFAKVKVDKSTPPKHCLGYLVRELNIRHKYAEASLKTLPRKSKAGWSDADLTALIVSIGRMALGVTPDVSKQRSASPPPPAKAKKPRRGDHVSSSSSSESGSGSDSESQTPSDDAMAGADDGDVGEGEEGGAGAGAGEDDAAAAAKAFSYALPPRYKAYAVGLAEAQLFQLNHPKVAAYVAGIGRDLRPSDDDKLLRVLVVKSLVVSDVVETPSTLHETMHWSVTDRVFQPGGSQNNPTRFAVPIRADPTRPVVLCATPLHALVQEATSGSFSLSREKVYHPDRLLLVNLDDTAVNDQRYEDAKKRQHCLPLPKHLWLADHGRASNCRVQVIRGVALLVLVTSAAMGDALSARYGPNCYLPFWTPEICSEEEAYIFLESNVETLKRLEPGNALWTNQADAMKRMGEDISARAIVHLQQRRKINVRTLQAFFSDVLKARGHEQMAPHAEQMHTVASGVLMSTKTGSGVRAQVVERVMPPAPSGSTALPVGTGRATASPPPAASEEPSKKKADEENAEIQAMKEKVAALQASLAKLQEQSDPPPPPPPPPRPVRGPPADQLGLMQMKLIGELQAKVEALSRQQQHHPPADTMAAFLAGHLPPMPAFLGGSAHVPAAAAAGAGMPPEAAGAGMQSANLPALMLAAQQVAQFQQQQEERARMFFQQQQQQQMMMLPPHAMQHLSAQFQLTPSGRQAGVPVPGGASVSAQATMLGLTLQQFLSMMTGRQQ